MVLFSEKAQFYPSTHSSATGERGGTGKSEWWYNDRQNNKIKMKVQKVGQVVAV